MAKQKLVKLCLPEDKRGGNLLTHINHLSPKADTPYILNKAILCILHLEMRVGIKLLTVLVLKGLSNTAEGRFASVREAKYYFLFR